MKELCTECGFGFSPFNVLPLPVENMISIREGNQECMKKLGLDRFVTDVTQSIALPQKLTLDDCLSKTVIPILPDGKVLACDYCYDMPRAVIAEDFLAVPYTELLERKRQNTVCRQCLHHGIPLLLNTVIDDTGHDRKRLARGGETCQL